MCGRALGTHNYIIGNLDLDGYTSVGTFYFYIYARNVYWSVQVVDITYMHIADKHLVVYQVN
jgi:hypothetical protein